MPQEVKLKDGGHSETKGKVIMLTVKPHLTWMFNMNCLVAIGIATLAVDSEGDG